jgi:hypothetical protein
MLASILASNGRQAKPLDAGDPYLPKNLQITVNKASGSWMKNEEVLALLEYFQPARNDWPREAAPQPNSEPCRS